MSEPTVTYNATEHQIFATVIAIPEPDDHFTALVAPITIPKGTWTVFWNVINESAPAEFSSIEIPADPLSSGNVTVSDSDAVPPPPPATQWTAVIENKVTSFNGFNYTIVLVPQGQTNPLSRHDPAIAVSSDPIGG
jgi:hypothetical protein